MTYSGSHEALCATSSANSPQKACKLSLLIGALRERPEAPDDGISRSRGCKETPSTTHCFADATKTEKETCLDAPSPPQVPKCCEGSS